MPMTCKLIIQHFKRTCHATFYSGRYNICNQIEDKNKKYDICFQSRASSVSYAEGIEDLIDEQVEVEEITGTGMTFTIIFFNIRPTTPYTIQSRKIKDVWSNHAAAI